MLFIVKVAVPLTLLGILNTTLFSFLFIHNIWYVPNVESVNVNALMSVHDAAYPPLMFIDIFD